VPDRITYEHIEKLGLIDDGEIALLDAALQLSGLDHKQVDVAPYVALV